MNIDHVKEIKASVDDLVQQFQNGLNEKGLKVDAVHLARQDDGGPAAPRFCFIDDDGRRICIPPED